MTTRMGALGVVLMAAALSACDSATGPSALQDNNNAQQRRFRALVGGSYSYEFQRLCFCAPPATTPVRIVVRDLEIESVTWPDGSPVPREDWAFYLTVDGVFEDIDAALREGAASVEASYDPALGYPSQTAIDVSFLIADEERYYTIRDLRPLP